MKWKQIVPFISYLQTEFPDCLSLSLQARKFYRFAWHLNIAASKSWFGRRGGGELFPFKQLLVQNEIPFKLKGLDWSLRIKENGTERKCGFSLELYLKRVTSDSAYSFSLLHPLAKEYVSSSFSCKSLNCINMCICLRSFLVWFGLQHVITACKNPKYEVFSYSENRAI